MALVSRSEKVRTENAIRLIRMLGPGIRMSDSAGRASMGRAGDSGSNPGRGENFFL